MARRLEKLPENVNDTRVNWCYSTALLLPAQIHTLYMTPYETRSMRELAASRSRPHQSVSQLFHGPAPREPSTGSQSGSATPLFA